MRAFEQFSDKGASFWAFVKFVSESLGYTRRGYGMVKSYEYDDIYKLCIKHNIAVDSNFIGDVVAYSNLRAQCLNEYARNMLMDVNSAQQEFQRLYSIYEQRSLQCALPFNKQRGSKRNFAFFTCIINILTELTIREITGDESLTGFDDDPRGLMFVMDENNNLIGSSSRRFDGAFPSILSPKIVWEIKEYYYTTSFGSRIADGIYETQLDGLEFMDLKNRTGKKIFHVLFIDAYQTWWIQGKSYLCRVIDALNAGQVDEVIIGREVFSRWPNLLKEVVSAEQMV